HVPDAPATPPHSSVQNAASMPDHNAGSAKTAGAETARRERLHQPYLITGRGESGQLLVAADGLTVRTEPFATESILSRIRAALPPQINVVEHALLSEYDAYYYSRGGEATLPVLRIKLDDP